MASSFSQLVKEECASILPEDHCCRTAELLSFLSEYSDDLNPEKQLKKNCCKRAFLRGVFLTSGFLSDPEKVYQLELSNDTEKRAKLVQKLLLEFDLNGKIVERKGRFVVYLKDGDQICDFLRLLSANRSVLALENVRVFKDVRNSINRKVNCETANLEKTVSAGLRDVKDIELIRDTIGLEKLPDVLYELAVVRLENPVVTIKELWELLDPPIGKSGVNHRLRRLHLIAEEGKL